MTLEYGNGGDMAGGGSEVQKLRGKLNPHLEPHGHHCVELSYHFPMRDVDVVEAKLKIVVPGEKASALARESLLSRIITHTRFSLAEEASMAADLSKAFYEDSLWIKKQLNRGSNFCGLPDLENSPVLLRYVREDFSMDFLSKLTLILQSHLKKAAKDAVNTVRHLEGAAFQANEIEAAKRDLDAFRLAFASGKFVLDATLIWRFLRELARAHPDRNQASESSSLERLCFELEEISELLIILMGKHVADIQDALFRVLDKVPASEATDLCLELVKCQLDELALRTNELVDARSQMGLPSLRGIDSDPDFAARFFERSIDLKREQYRKWDLQVVLKPSRYFFVRVKDLLKLRLKLVRKQKSGKWQGACYFSPPGFDSEKKEQRAPICVLNLERRTAWERHKREWHLHLSEVFRPASVQQKIPSNIVKQLWRIPFDEILDSLDDTVHILRIPSMEGRPVHVKTHKRITFPFQLTVRTCTVSNSDVRTCEESNLRGHIVVFGAQVVAVELS